MEHRGGTQRWSTEVDSRGGAKRWSTRGTNWAHAIIGEINQTTRNAALAAHNLPMKLERGLGKLLGDQLGNNNNSGETSVMMLHSQKFLTLLMQGK